VKPNLATAFLEEKIPESKIKTNRGCELVISCTATRLSSFEPWSLKKVTIHITSSKPIALRVVFGNLPQICTPQAILVAVASSQARLLRHTDAKSIT